MLGIVVLAVFLIIKIAVEAIDEREDTNTGKTFCTSRSEFCTEQYAPVCGWYDSDKIQCIKYPCAQTYSNSCFACVDKNVKYYTNDKCPD